VHRMIKNKRKQSFTQFLGEHFTRGGHGLCKARGP
jgi:hypothetical protein